ncbi:N-acetylmuramoyl-L-alanine amidase [Nonomuraea maritima]|uniref:N-acetylmuramoyl-L-alanine amidase n=1 Tax=Nonomuraea maritima TaxID=683260 RepID=A0A1G8Y1U3_9ACTN|nr:N-acetylmuramoyl-L-alanine amidase [Nonomuraea maritima]SDJ96713.1 N-acetylmuramoyl-L-alanine amidase [Nonomuraea maritima]
MHLWLAAVMAAGVLTAPAVEPRDSGAPPPSGVARGPSRQADFASAARAYGVPESVLLGVSYLQSRWDANGGRPSTAGGYGPMHLVDAFPADSHAHGHHIGDALGDPRGDDARPMALTLTDLTPAGNSALRLAAPAYRTTLPEAGHLTGLPADRLRTDPSANIHAGAALLASYHKGSGADPADWYDAVAAYAGTDDPAAARAFADEVFSVMREGVTRRTDDGHLVRLAPVPGLLRPASAGHGPPELDPAHRPPEHDPGLEPGADGRPDNGPDSRSGSGDEAGWSAGEDPGAPWASGPEEDPGGGYWTPGHEERAETPRSAAGSKAAEHGKAECPASLHCEWMPAAHQRWGKKGHRDYGNHDRLARERSVDYIVIHDTEGTYQGIPSMVRNPKYVSWHYTIRSRDGHVAQHVRTNDIAWHAGNWDVNTRSIGIEHEGYLAKGGTWYTEAMYRASAKLVKYLAAKYDIPLDRAHILGHDNVPGTTAQTVSGMHDDPGPYWDWAHYFELMGKPFRAAKGGDSVLILPSYNANRPRFTGCEGAGKRCPPHGASTVWLHKSPSHKSPLVLDVGKHGGKPSTHSVYDHAARASAGQRFAVAERRGDWTAIWYLGQKAWFHNPPGRPTAVPAKGTVVTPVSDDVKVYGRAYPERSAYKSAAYQRLAPLQYRIAPGQEYTVGLTVTGSHYSANAFDPSKHVTTTGTTRYHQIQLGHRVMFVMAKDVRFLH